MAELVEAIQARTPKIAVLTDGINDPVAIADLLRQRGADEEYTMWVCENLGGADERVSCHAPAAMGKEAFAVLNVVILLHNANQPVDRPVDLPILGLPETALQHQAGPRG